MGLRAWVRHGRQRHVDKVVGKVSAHVPTQQPGLRLSDPPGPTRCAACKHVFDGADGEVRRHQIEVAYRMGENGAAFTG